MPLPSSRITESEDATNRPGVAKYIQQFANNLTASADQKPTNAEQEREDRPSTAQKALDVTMTVQHEMQALQANMARMMAELEALRCGQLNGKMPSIQEEAGPEFGEVGKAAVVADQRAVVGNKNANSAPEDASELGSRVDMDELDEMVKEAEANRIDPLDALIAEMDDDRLSQGSGDGDEDEDEGSTDGRPLREVTEAELATHDREESLWMGVEGMVYDLTDWVDSHPGGRGLLLGNAGTDATAAFFSAHTGGSKFPAARRLAELPIVGRLSVSLRKLHTQSPVKQPGADTAGGGPYDELQF